MPRVSRAVNRDPRQKPASEAWFGVTKMTKERRVVGLLLRALVFGMLVVSAACTDEEVNLATSRGEGPEVIAEAQPDSEHSIKLFVGNGSEQELVEFGPMGALPDSKQSQFWMEDEDGGGEDKLLLPGLEEQVVVEGDPTLPYNDTNEEDERLGYAPGWKLASLLAKSCTGDSLARGRPGTGVNNSPWGWEH